MARTPTTNIPLGFKAPTFKLPDVVSNKDIELSDLVTENGLVVMFICNHCPFVVHVIEQIVSIANDYLEKKIGFVSISSNDIVNYPNDSPEKMRKFAQKYIFHFLIYMMSHRKLLKHMMPLAHRISVFLTKI